MGLHVSFRVLSSLHKHCNHLSVHGLMHNLSSPKTRQLKFLVCPSTTHMFRASFKTDVNCENFTNYFYLRELPKEECLMLTEIDRCASDLVFEGFCTRLYSNVEDPMDPILESLVRAATIEEVFSLVQGHLNNVKYASQAIATLWDLQNGYHNWRSNLGLINNQEHNENFIQAVKSQPQFLLAVESVEKSSELLSDDILTSVLLFLRKFQIYPWNPLLHSTLCTALARARHFSLTALSKWCLATSQPTHTGRLILPSAIPAFHDHVNRCQTLADFKLLSVCFIAISPLVDKLGPTSKLFVDRMIHLLDTNFLNRETPLSVLVMVLRALYQVAKSNPSSSAASLRILYILQDSPHMNDVSSVVHFNAIRRSWEAVSEPIGLVRKMEDVTCRLLEELDIRMEHIELLTHVSHSASHDRRKKLERHLMHIMETERIDVLEPYLKHIFRIVRSSKISDLKLVDTYWLLVLKNLEKRCGRNEEFLSHFLEAAQWYMFFNNNLGGTYRSKAFENRVLVWIQSIVGDWNQPIRNVRFFCRLAAFVLAYSGYPLPHGLLEKLIEIEEQLTIQDIFYLSRGIQLGRHWLRRPEFLYLQRDLGELLLVLDRRSEALLSSKMATALGLSTTLLHSILYRSIESYSVRDSLSILEIALHKCETQLKELTGRLSRDLIFFLDRFRYLRLPIVDMLIAYALKNHEHLGPSILVNVLVLCFNLGYSPKNFDLLAPIASEALESWKENGMFGLFVLESALALLLSNQLPLKLVNEIFTVQFLDKLDAEVAACYSKASYPARVRRTLMELNRSVCIDMPEAGVPWFHEKYCREQSHLNPPLYTSFHADIYQCLVKVLVDAKYIKQWSYSPYYHLIDFEVHFNKYGQSVIPYDNKDTEKTIDEHYDKVAILALLPPSFTTNPGNMTGLTMLRQRQLEILGYRVLSIPHHQWNSLALSSFQSKCNYLSHKLCKQQQS